MMLAVLLVIQEAREGLLGQGCSCHSRSWSHLCVQVRITDK